MDVVWISSTPRNDEFLLVDSACGQDPSSTIPSDTDPVVCSFPGILVHVLISLQIQEASLSNSASFTSQVFGGFCYDVSKIQFQCISVNVEEFVQCPTQSPDLNLAGTPTFCPTSLTSYTSDGMDTPPPHGHVERCPCCHLAVEHFKRNIIDWVQT